VQRESLERAGHSLTRTAGSEQQQQQAAPHGVQIRKPRQMQLIEDDENAAADFLLPFDAAKGE
jgi:hypothetical protein